MNVVIYEMRPERVYYDVVCYELVYVVRYVLTCYEPGLLWAGLLWIGLLRTGLLWTWLFLLLNVVCYEQICYQRGLLLA